MVKPQNIIVDIASRQLQINWSDGQSCVYEFTELRRACPCAACQPWKEGLGPVGVIAESARRAVGELRRIEDVTLVGAYALHFDWTDGHGSGIYSFDYLYHLCSQEAKTALAEEGRTS